MAQGTLAIAEQIESSTRIPLEEQAEAFRYVAANYSHDVSATPPEIQRALLAYLSNVAKSEVAVKPTDLDPEALPIWIAIRHAAPDAKVYSAIAVRPDLPLSSRLKAVENFKKEGKADALTSVGKYLMVKADLEDRFVAATAFTSLDSYPLDAAEFLNTELTSGQRSRVPVIFESQEQTRKLYKNLDAAGKDKLSKYVRSKGAKMILEE